MIRPDLNATVEAVMECPGCGEPVSENLRRCERCGFDLAIAALLAEQQATLPLYVPQGIAMSPELLVPRIGDYLIEGGLLSPSDLLAALSYQKQRSIEGKPVLLGQALLELGMISREALDQVITAQILQLQCKLNEANQSLKQRVDDRTQELRRALERLSELNQLKSNFIANISHELRTPLTHIKGYLDILAEGGLGDINESQREALEVVSKAEERLERLIDDLIQFSFAARGELSLQQDDLDARRLVDYSVERSRTKAGQQEIKINVNQPVQPIKIHADEDKLAWVLMQMIDNAIKFSPRGGLVTIGVSADTSQWVRFMISDTGIGIPAEHLEDIFEPFHQLDSSTTRRYPGTGLGLAMVRRIIEAHGSQVHVNSIVGKGSEFEFRIPAAKTL